MNISLSSNIYHHRYYIYTHIISVPPIFIHRYIQLYTYIICLSLVCFRFSLHGSGLDRSPPSLGSPSPAVARQWPVATGQPGDWRNLKKNVFHLLITTGWWFEPLWKYESIGMIIPNIWENKKWSKPPTSLFCSVQIWNSKSIQHKMINWVQNYSMLLHLTWLSNTLKRLMICGFCGFSISM